jgi:hypothetical protein
MAYWVVLLKQNGEIVVIRMRTNPGNEFTFSNVGVLTLDGPHHEQEDAARSLAFWRHQYGHDGHDEHDAAEYE